MEEVPRRSSLAPLAIPRFCALLNRGGNRRAFRQPGEGRDHVHCAAEPSPGHIWRRFVSNFWPLPLTKHPSVSCCQ